MEIKLLESYVEILDNYVSSNTFSQDVKLNELLAVSQDFKT